MANGLNHWETSRRFIIQADAEFAAGDLLQASEKGWGAAAHAMKAIAQEREWRHDSHARLFGIADRLASITGMYEIPDLFQTASEVHKNFYEGNMSKERIADGLADIRRLLDILASLSTETN